MAVKLKSWPVVVFMVLAAIVCLAPTVQMKTSSGVAGRVPYWTNGPFLSQTSNIYHDGTNVGIGTVNPVYLLNVEKAGTSDPLVRFGGTAASDSISFLFAGATTTGLKIFHAGGADAFMTGTVQDDTGIIFSPGKSYHVGSSGVIVQTINATGMRVGLAGSFITNVVTATATLDFGSILAAQSADLTIAVTGAKVNDSVALGLPAAPTAAIAWNAFVSSAGVVTVRANNVGTIAADPASATYRVTCIGF